MEPRCKGLMAASARQITLILYPCGKYANHLRETCSLDSAGCREERLTQQAARGKASFVPVPPESVDQTLSTLTSPKYPYVIWSMMYIFLFHPGVQKEKFHSSTGGRQAAKMERWATTLWPGPDTWHNCLRDHMSVQITVRRSRSLMPLGKWSN